MLIEPDYRNKYPPIALMKFATYHKNHGHDVRFIKGNLKQLQGQKFDVVCVTTLFTFYWKKIIETVDAAKKLVAQDGELMVGGVAATLMADELKRETGVEPVEGCLDAIDELPLDYTILDEIEYKYPVTDAYFMTATRGCIRACPFCAVKTLEPVYKGYIDIKPRVEYINRYYGEKKDMLMMDNNVFASESFDRIIDDLKECGFARGAKLGRRSRYVDFNQGLDARLVTEERMAKLAEINVRPVRIAFDNWEQRDIYEQAIRTAAKYGHKEMANYMLYNFTDSPDDLYKRIELTEKLGEELGVRINSFPMKYHPLRAKDRKYIGPQWTRQYIRAVQCMLNTPVSKGHIGTSMKFFRGLMGRDLNEFQELLHMPEELILTRNKNPEALEQWRKEYRENLFERCG